MQSPAHTNLQGEVMAFTYPSHLLNRLLHSHSLITLPMFSPELLPPTSCYLAVTIMFKILLAIKCYLIQKKMFITFRDSLSLIIHSFSYQKTIYISYASAYIYMCVYIFHMYLRVCIYTYIVNKDEVPLLSFSRHVKLLHTKQDCRQKLS